MDNRPTHDALPPPPGSQRNISGGTRGSNSAGAGRRAERRPRRAGYGLRRSSNDQASFSFLWSILRSERVNRTKCLPYDHSCMLQEWMGILPAVSRFILNRKRLVAQLAASKASCLLAWRCRAARPMSRIQVTSVASSGSSLKPLLISNSCTRRQVIAV